jgi:prepilin-type N-terminal cleavage/methylation domain-containing protein
LRAGFTLLEVILAVTIAGALLSAAATLMVSVTNAWMERQDKHFFVDHVDGVTEFLQACFTAAGSEITLTDEEDSQSESDDSATDNSENGEENQPPETAAETTEGSVEVSIDGDDTSEGGKSSSESTTTGGLLSTAEDPIEWANPPGFADYQDPLLHFSLNETPPLLVQAENAPSVGVEVYLYFESDEGLSLLWYSSLQEDSEDINDLNRTPLSDLVTKIEYVYWDDSFEKWEVETEPQESDEDDEFTLPRFLKLTFEYEGETKERILTIPVASRSVILF